MKKTIKICTIALSVFTLLSCNKVKNNPCDKNTPTKSEATAFDYKQLPFANNTSSTLLAAKTTGTIVIATWDEWGRASKDCKKWGLCNFEWFPDSRVMTYSAPIVQDEKTGQYYLEILYSADMPWVKEDKLWKEIKPQLETLPIDADIIVHTAKSVIGKDLTAKAGEYPYDPSIGAHGGYRVYLY